VKNQRTLILLYSHYIKDINKQTTQNNIYRRWFEPSEQNYKEANKIIPYSIASLHTATYLQNKSILYDLGTHLSSHILCEYLEVSRIYAYDSRKEHQLHYYQNFPDNIINTM
jgi:hypothetical protein